MSQVKIDFLVTGNMSSLNKQVQALNAQLMSVAGTMTAVDRSMSNIDLQAANAQFGRMIATSGQFSQQMVTMKTHTDLFAESLSKQQVTMGQALRETRNYIAQRGGLIRNLAKQQVMMQNSVVMPQGIGPDGKVQARVITPTGLDKDFATQMRVANKSWEVFNATAQQGATHMVNWGKNTQWAGRQLMVGFTVPLMIAGGLAAKTFKDLDEELVRLQKVYGSGFSFGEDFQKQSEMVRESAMQMAHDMAQAYGQAGTDTAALMADLAATGFEGQDLMKMTEQTTKLATLGEVDRQEAMKATVALQSAFKMSTDEVADSVLFLNAVENQTSASLQDLVEAIPRAGTVVEGLGGSIEDLALYMVAFREGGISAAEGANALKSGLSSVIAPPQAAVEFMKEFGINLPAMVKKNAGDLTGTLMAFQKELQGLDDLARQQVITKLFGKYQFARMNAFFNNLGAKGSQTQKVLELMGYSMEDLGKLAEQELGAQAESVSGKWTRAWEEFKINIAEVGEDLLKLGTMALGALNKVFGFLEDNKWAMDLVKYLGMAAAAIGPVIMLMGLFGNMIGMIIKGVLRLSNGFKALTSGGGIARTFEMLTAESFQADSAVDQLTTSMYNQATAQEVLTQAVMEYTGALEALQGQASGAVVAVDKVSAAASGATSAGRLNLGATSYGSKERGVGFFAGDYVSNSKLGENPRTAASQASMALANKKLLAQATVLDLVAAESAGGKYRPETKELEKSVVALDKAAAQVQALEAAGKDTTAALAQQEAAQKRVNAATEAATAGLITEEEAARRVALVKTEEGRRALAAENQARELQYQASGRYQGKSGGQLTTMRGFNYAASIQQGLFDPNEARKLLSLVSDDVVDFANNARDAGAAFEHLTPVSWDLEKRMKYISAELDEAGTATDAFARAMVESAAAGQGLTLDEAELAAATDLLATSRRQQLAAEKALYTAISNETAALNLTEASAEKVNSAFLSAAKETSETAVSMQTVESANGKYVAMVNDAGAVIPGTTYKVGSRGGATPIDMDAFQRELDDATVTTKKLASAEEIAAARSMDKSAADAVDEAATQRHTSAVVADTGAENAETAANIRATQSEDAETAANARSAATEAVSGSTGGVMNYMKNNKAMLAGGALMGGAMLGSTMLPEGPASNVANMTMMGAGVGGMFGPWGLAIGGLAGLAGGIFTEIFKDAKEESDRRAAEAAAEWDASFKSIELDKTITDQLKLGKLEVQVIPSVDIERSIPKGAKYDEWAASVGESFETEINKLSDMGDDSLAVAQYAEKMFLQGVSQGLNPEKMREIVNEVLRQGGKSEAVIPFGMSISGVIDEKGAEARLSQSVQESQRRALAGINQEDFYDIGMKGSQADEKMAESGKTVATAYIEGFNSEFQAGLIDEDKYFKSMLAKRNEMVRAMTDQANVRQPNQMVLDTLKGIGIEVTSQSDLVTQFMGRNAEEQEGIINRLRAAADSSMNIGDRERYLEQANLLSLLKEGTGEYARQIMSTNPELKDQIDFLMEHGMASNIDEAAVLALKDAQLAYNQALREQNLESAFMKSASQYVEVQEQMQKTNIAQLERQNERELEALQEREDAKLEAMQEAADERERLMEKEITQTERQYDKEIEAIQKAEEKRQEAFQNEQERAQRRQEMRNMEISYQEAIANGDLFEAARIRMDIAALKKQREAESKEEKRQEKADKKIAKLEKERDQKLRILNQELRQEQRANEKMIESAQEASDAKVEAAQKAADKEVRLAEKANEQIVNQQAKTDATLAKMWQALLTGNMDDYKKYAKELKISNREQEEIFEAMFGKVPEKLRKSLQNGIQTKDWNMIGKLLEKAVMGKKYDPDGPGGQVAEQSGKGSGPSRGYARGGFVTGPGSETSDSIPARLSNGEYVMTAAAVRKHGKAFMDKVNNTKEYGGRGGKGRPVGFAGGGLVDAGMYGGTASGLIKMITSAVDSVVSAPGAILSESFPGMKGVASGKTLIWIPSSENDEPVDQLTAAQLRVAGKLLGSRVYVTQGSYQPQTTYSGTTHMGGGVIDVPSYGGMYGPGVKALQRAGFAAWWRGPQHGDWGEHIHAISLFSKNLSSAAAAQRAHYINQTGDGLGGSYYGPHLAPIAGLRSQLGLRRGGRINYDNTIANLHRGETVLTRSLTDKLENNIANLGGNEYNFDVTIENLSSDVDLERAFERFVVKHERRQQARAGRSRRV